MERRGERSARTLCVLYGLRLLEMAIFGAALHDSTFERSSVTSTPLENAGAEFTVLLLTVVPPWRGAGTRLPYCENLSSHA